MLGVFGNKFKKSIPVPYNGGSYKRDAGRTPTPIINYKEIIQNIKSLPTKAKIEIALKQEIQMLAPPQNSSPIIKQLATELKPQVNHLQRLKILFKPLLEASYQTIDKAKEVANRFNLIFDSELSNENTYVYLDRETGFPLVVHRGSVELIRDWLISDVLIATGLSTMFNPRISMAQQIVKKVEAKYKKPSDGFGHSLGGEACEESGATGYILTYNKASGPLEIGQKTNPKQIDYRARFDIVSLLAETQNTNIKYIENNEGILYSHGLSILPEVQQRRV